MKIIVCIPGRSVSTEFLTRWTLVSHALAKENAVVLRTAYSPNVYYARMACLDLSPKTAAPFNGTDYDKILWIDTDIIFTMDAILAVLNSQHPIVAGLYYTGVRYQDGTHQLCTVKDMDEEYCDKHGTYEFMTDKSLSDMKWDPDKTAKVAYTGMGLMAVEKGVTEALGYETFKPVDIRKTGFAADDASFCLRAAAAGIETRIHLDAFVNHEKMILV